MACLSDCSWGQRSNNKLYKGTCPCGYTFESLSTTTRIINHYRFDAYAGPSPGVDSCKFTREQLSASFPDFWEKRDAYFAKKVKPAQQQKRGAPSTAPSGQSPLAVPPGLVPFTWALISSKPVDCDRSVHCVADLTDVALPVVRDSGAFLLPIAHVPWANTQQDT